MAKYCAIISGVVLLVTILYVNAHQPTYHMFTQSQHVENQHKHHHKCVHDALFENELKSYNGDRSKSALFRGLDNPIPLPTAHRLVRSIDSNNGKRKVEKVYNVFSRIRITLDTTYLTSDEESRSCYSNGATFRRGNPSSQSDSCTSTVTTNCFGICKSTDVISSAKSSRVLSLVQQVRTKIESQITTRPLVAFSVSPLAPKCGAEGGVSWPSNVVQPNSLSNVDLYIFVTMRPAETGIAAWATACSRELIFNRPIAGQLNINPSILDTYPNDDTILLSTIEHEVTHILGFSSSMYGSYRDDNGNSMPSSSVVGSRQGVENGVSVTRQFFIHPKMTNMYRNLTGCSNVDGVPIEEFGSSGSAGSHFDGRVFVNELMAPSLDGCGNFGRSCVTTTATLAFLETTGWYKSSVANPIIPAYGRNMGCSFANQRCSTWDNDRLGYFCSDTTQKKVSCVYHMRDKGVCDLVTYTSALPAQYQYFTNNRLGGRVSWFDFCPLQRRYMSCGDKNMPKRSPEVFNSNSACFAGNLELSRFSGTMESEDSSRCLVYNCDRVNKVLKIRLHTTSNYITCPSDQSYQKFTSISGFKGSIACPKNGYTILCESYEIPPSTDDGTGRTIPSDEAGNEKSDGTTPGRICFLGFCWGSTAQQIAQYSSSNLFLFIGIVILLNAMINLLTKQ